VNADAGTAPTAAVMGEITWDGGQWWRDPRWPAQFADLVARVTATAAELSRGNETGRRGLPPTG
jgi:hypothetical protein